MNSLSDNHDRELDSQSASYIVNIHDEVEATRRMILVQWLNNLLPSICLPTNIMDDELRARLTNGTVLCQILNKLRPGSVSLASDSDISLSSDTENVRRFLVAMDKLGLPHFEISDLEKGSMKAVVDCLLTLRAKGLQNSLVDKNSKSNVKSRSPRSPSSGVFYSPSSKEDQRKVSFESKSQRVLRSPVMAEPSPALIHHVGHKSHEVFQVKHGSYVDLHAAKISEIMRSNNLDNAPTQSLLSVVNGILDESVERRNNEIPHRVACLLRRVVQEIERRISTQAEYLRTQNNLFKAREEKYQSRIRVLDALASGIREESQIVTSRLQQLKTEKTEEEVKKRADEDDIRLKKELDEKSLEISMLKQELETTKKTHESKHSQLEAEATGADEDFTRKMKELDDKNMEISMLKQELETTKKTYGSKHSQLEVEAKGADEDFTRKMKDLDDKNMEISMLKQELETTKRTYELRCSQLEAEAKGTDKDFTRKMKDLDDKNMEISMLKQELETTKRTYELRCSQLEAEAKDTDKDFTRKMKDLDDKNMEISMLKQELETTKRTCELRCSQLEAEAKGTDKDFTRKMKDLDDKNMEISMLKQELETTKRTCELRCSQLEAEAKGTNKDFTRKMKDLDDKNMEISMLKQELETTKRTCELRCSQLEAEAKGTDKDFTRKMKDLDDKNMEISMLKQELETTKRTYELRCSQLEAEAKGTDKDFTRKMKDLDDKNMEISMLKQELETTKRTYELRYSQLEAEAKGTDEDFTRKMKDLDDKNMEILMLKQELETTKKTFELRCSQFEAEAKGADEDLTRKMKDLDKKNMEISTLKQELETTKKTYELRCSQLEAEAKGADDDLTRKMKDLDRKNMEITTLKQELETTKETYESRCSQLDAKAKGAKGELEQKSKEYEHLIEDVRNKHELKYQNLLMKNHQLQKAVDFQFGSLQQLKVLWGSIKQDIMQGQSIYSEECNRLGRNLKSLVDAAENYRAVLAENKRLFNEVQELKGNIRVYCRIRPFIPGQKEKRSIVEHIGDNDLVVANPSKQGKDALRSFKFNKVFGPASTQAGVYSDIQAFIRSVLDGYNVCIFAYGQTGSGKTYTMSGPNGATEESFGVNYRALNDLFNISKSRASSFLYEIGVQMVEIYNEQVRDLLLTDGSPRKLGIMNHSPSKGVAVPDARMVPVKSPSDVMKLIELGLRNRAMGATAMNERSSRSHSVVSIHVEGTDLKSGSTLHGNLHLVDLAGSERVDRSEVTGDRLREAQHINKSLSALGDVIFALSQKSSHVPYRNSKLTQILQSSLGGQAKTLMFVQLNPDVVSFSESLSTLKFAERVSGIELGAAKSSKEGRDVRELMEQVASLKDTISKKDEEIDRLQLLKDLKNAGVNSEKHEIA
ncbi:hypothetical protein L6164_000037 [Bauhinia variegata]|uniref:Uncharacterized protein n=1 Tax=Bauhinia variegata TaxID=167791 RepID=A0ACB9Q5J3_BAUVA|nr:hypothetical protein L6164_000037 [Bauhinia variegata]